MDTTLDPYALFTRWFDEAKAAEPRVPNAVALATVDARGRPSIRQVLLKALRIGHIKHVIGRRADGLREIDRLLGDWRSLSWVRNV